MEQIFVGSDFMTGGVPYWVGKRDQARSNIAHMDSERRLYDRIKELEEENSDLKKKIAKFESAFLTAMDLLMK